MTVGVLALQGGFKSHVELLKSISVDVCEVRSAEQLRCCTSLIIPGGESTTISKLLISSGIYSATLQMLSNDELAIFGTCAGAIICAHEILDGRRDQISLDIFPAIVRRNGEGRQSASHEEPLIIKGLHESFNGVFIRPPVFEKVDDAVEVLAKTQTGPVLCGYQRHLFASFHPELTDSAAVHRMFLERAKQ